MARVKITIELDNGDIPEIEQKLSEGSLETFDQIEDFTLSARRALFPKLQEQLLSKSQRRLKKRRINVKRYTHHKHQWDRWDCFSWFTTV